MSRIEYLQERRAILDAFADHRITWDRAHEQLVAAYEAFWHPMAHLEARTP